MSRIVRSVENLSKVNHQATTTFSHMNSKEKQSITEHFTVNPSLHGLLIGKKGSRIKKMTEDTNTRIHVQRGTDQVIIRGQADDVRRAKAAIERVIRPPRPTHFLSLPISGVSQPLGELYSRLVTVDPLALVSPANFHITVGVLCLLNQTEIDWAMNYLKEEGRVIVDSVLKQAPLNVKLQQLATMQSNPAEAHVLYFEPQDETQRLGELCRALIDKMVQRGFMQRESRGLKLHATIVNTSHSKKGNARIGFDATRILEDHGKMNLGKVQLDQLHLMKMGRTGPGKTYESEGYILLE